LLAVWIQGMCDIGTERRMPAFVLDDGKIIHPYAGRIIDGAEVQYHPAACRKLRAFEAALIPATAMETRVPDTAQLRFRREWHLDHQRPGFDIDRGAMTQFVIKQKTPRTVQTLPLRSLQQRPWIACAGIVEIAIHHHVNRYSSKRRLHRSIEPHRDPKCAQMKAPTTNNIG